MSLILALGLQAAAVATPAAPAPPPAATTNAPRWAMIAPAAQQGDPLDFDLARYRASGEGSCAGAGAGDVLVCGPRRGRGDYPLDYWDRVFAEPPLRAEVGLGGGATGDVHVEQHDFGNGRVARRVMVGIKLPF